MKFFSAVFATVLLIAAVALLYLAATMKPAAAREAFVQDGAGLFSAATVSSLNSEIGDFNRQTNKEIVIVTVPSYTGTLNDAVERTFAQQQVNGVLFYFAKATKEDRIVGDKASRAFFPPGEFKTIHDAMRGYFRSGDFDTGIKTGVNLVLGQYRSHERGLTPVGVRETTPVTRPADVGKGFFNMSFILLIVVLVVGFLIIRGIFRMFAGPRMMGPPGGYGGPGYGGPGYGGPGYGGGYGPGYGGGGGGGFFSGLLGGLGGAFIGNELFGGNRGETIIEQPVQQAGFDGGSAPDNSGWQSDAGQIDSGNMGGGGWGDSGGGFDSGGGGGDFGGGGDSGGGW